MTKGKSAGRKRNGSSGHAGHEIRSLAETHGATAIGPQQDAAPEHSAAEPRACAGVASSIGWHANAVQAAMRNFLSKLCC